MNHEIVDAVSQLMREKNIDRDILQEIIEGVFKTILKKKYGSSDNFEIIFNMDKGDIEIYCEKVIMEDGGITDPLREIELGVARTEDPDLEVGDEYVEIINYKDFGRRLIISAKQNLIQKIKEIEKENIYNEFKDRVGEIVIGDIHQVNRREVKLNVERIEVIMPRGEQVYNERYRRGDSLRVLVKEVNRTTREPEITVSRSDPDFLRRLFELEVPEIFDGIIEIQKIVRAPGDRAKVAVISNDKRIDPVGACVGMKGVRIQAIVRELNNEKVDIVKWDEDPKHNIRRALGSLIEAREILLNEEEKKAQVVLPDDQMSLAIGRRGHNLRLASELTGYDIEPIKESEYHATEEELELAEVEGLGKATLKRLLDAGYQYAEEVLDEGREKLLSIPGIGEKKSRKIIQILENYYE
ncbi:transcription termination factor NusA [candidate division KSB1 bacterium]|nr:transcription termination factor NusA [candidate division KSB1 bacterium]